LRGGASLIVAGLSADGLTEISNIHYIDRGYQEVEKVLSSIGANIKRV
jgi:UDP-N-acetylglucosamine 1-carboxyvinyltransferase